MALPSPSEDTCFDPQVFQAEDFSVDVFVSECKKKVSTQHLHDDLHSYYDTLKTAMVELINKDYADFLDLSANLVGMDKQIEAIALPMSQLHQEIQIIKYSMEKVAVGLRDTISARDEIRRKQVLLKKVMEAVESVELLEGLLEGEQQQLGGGCVGLERLAMEFNRLRHNVQATEGVPLIHNMLPRIDVITNRFQTILEGMLSRSLGNRDHTLLLQTLETYSLVCNAQAAESMFRDTVVAPGLKEIVTAKTLVTGGLDQLYSDILGFVPRQCGFMLEVSGGVASFDILVNAVWAEIVSAIEMRASSVFGAGNPDTFYKNFTSTMSFLDQFERNCSNVDHVKKLRAHPAYSRFFNKWSLPVYFQIRFQEIGGKLESHLELPLKAEASSHVFQLTVFSSLHSSLQQCWKVGVYLPALVHRFWKLTLQLVVRVKFWLKEVAENHRETLTLNDCTQLVHDINSLQGEVSILFDKCIKSELVSLLGEEKTTIQKGLVDGLCRELVELIPVLSDIATSALVQQSVRNLDPVQTIPRLYRRTNREVPVKPSGYVHNVLKPLSQINCDLLGDQYSVQWKETVIERVTEKYQELTSDVLSNVKRTEDSLSKLKRNRRSIQPVELEEGMSDDNKIRLQLAIDIEAYSKEARVILPTATSLSHFQSLLDMASVAKTKAITN